MKINEINAIEFSGYGKIVKKFSDAEVPWKQTTISPTGDRSEELWRYGRPVYLEPLEGTGVIFVESGSQPIKMFLLDKPIVLDPDCSFCILSYYSDFKCIMAAPDTRETVRAGSVLTASGIYPNIVAERINTVLYQERTGKFSFKGEKHPYWEMTYMDVGSMVCTVDGVDYELKKGEMMFFAPMQYHLQWGTGGEPLAFLTVTFEISEGDMTLLSDRVLSSSADMHRVMKTILSEYREDNIYSGGMILASLMQAIIISMRSLQMERADVNIQSNVSDKTKNDIVERCIQIIDSELQERITLEMLAKRVCVSMSYISKLFRSELGMGVSVFIKERRLDRAKELIRSGKYTITQVSDMMGFCSVTYFSTEFKRKFGVTPSDYSRSIAAL
ncbi:MAG: helix-turn-helix domain-containing protein [Oscillospiraceae bacterium]|nr:helix-turn-helix domain-containing protein [Oscillospiraceae bacterium]